jgi:hypothetical protein
VASTILEKKIKICFNPFNNSGTDFKIFFFIIILLMQTFKEIFFFESWRAILMGWQLVAALLSIFLIGCCPSSPLLSSARKGRMNPLIIAASSQFE